MKRDENCLPEGFRSELPENRAALASLDALRQAGDAVLEATASRCSCAHDLLIELGWTTAVIPRAECALGLDTGETREIAILSRVGKPVCFRVTSIDDSVSPPAVTLSRKSVLEQAQDMLLDSLAPGDILPARVTHIEPFGVFVDIGCGVVSMIGIEHLSVSRILHPAERFRPGQDIYAVVLSVDRAAKRINLSHRELLGTWEENAALFAPGETVRGVVRSIENYGVFIELMPNLSGLAERRAGLREGQTVSVFLKSIVPERMKIKLTIIDLIPPPAIDPPAPRYFLTKGHLDRWVYTPPACESKHIETIFGT
ncbi:MAG: 30S ribosomal protein S1 [Clostridiaceae bacterium]|nr:30S ribosomal protein S1 [Clostridiaceae bacterium]MCI9484985.1 30S ribosomal protein S1 [Clostridiaceae bacterium]NBH78631.1 30S ribosomal protein S1 [Clostridiaceae bacterium]